MRMRVAPIAKQDARTPAISAICWARGVAPTM